MTIGRATHIQKMNHRMEASYLRHMLIVFLFLVVLFVVAGLIIE